MCCKSHGLFSSALSNLSNSTVARTGKSLGIHPREDNIHVLTPSMRCCIEVCQYVCELLGDVWSCCIPSWVLGIQCHPTVSLPNEMITSEPCNLRASQDAFLRTYCSLLGRWTLFWMVSEPSGHHFGWVWAIWAHVRASAKVGQGGAGVGVVRWPAG